MSKSPEFNLKVIAWARDSVEHLEALGLDRGQAIRAIAVANGIPSKRIQAILRAGVDR
jgi:hypothetical protein